MSQPAVPQQNIAKAIAEQDLSDLQQISNILHLIHYRNKNQHRRAKWWKDFSIFRREVRRVLDFSTPESEEPQRKGKGSFQRRKQSRERNESRRKLAAARLGFWKEAGLVEEWYIAFTHLTTSTRFSTLGLVILGCLASVCRTTNITQAFETEAQEELHTLLARFANEEGESLFGQGERVGQEKVVGNEDLGKRIAREEIAMSRAEDAVGGFEGSVAKRPRLEEEEGMTFPTSAMLGGTGGVTGTVENEDARVTAMPEDVPAKRPGGEDALDTMDGLPKQRLQTSTVTTGQVRVAPKMKRRRGKADAIDDIFGDL